MFVIQLKFICAMTLTWEDDVHHAHMESFHGLPFVLHLRVLRFVVLQTITGSIHELVKMPPIFDSLDDVQGWR